MVYAEITWIFVCSIFLSFFVAWGIGANDVANAFGSSVGSKALTMRQAVLVAAVCEFAGAVLMGSGVTSTIRSGVANVSHFTQTPDLLAYGQLCVMLATGIWLLAATMFELPVSTTHSVVGAIIGMTMVASSPSSVVWYKSSSTFPYFSGVAAIVSSWVVSPVIAAAFAIILFFSLRLIILRAKNAYQRSIYLLPFLVYVTIFIVTYFIMVKGGQQFNWQSIPDAKKAWISAIVALGCAGLAIWPGIPFLKSRVERDLKREEEAKAKAMEAAVTGKDEENPVTTSSNDSVEGNSPKADKGESLRIDSQKSTEDNPRVASRTSLGGNSQTRPPLVKRITPKELVEAYKETNIWNQAFTGMGKTMKKMTAGMDVDVHAVAEEDETIHQIHDLSEKFDHKSEKAFKYLQVVTAMANSFAHGSNDVANAIGPFAAIYQIWRDTYVSSKATVPEWIMVVGGAGIVVGLATYGYKIIRVLGVKMTKLTNSRGFTVELCAAAVVILGSRFNLPLSTTHTMVGAVTGIGILERSGAFNWMLLVKFFAGWVATLVVAGLTAAAFTAQGIYAPSRTCTHQRVDTGFYLNGTSNAVAALLNATGYATNNQTLVQQAQEIVSSAALLIPTPIVDLIPATQVQGQALIYATNASVW